MCGNFQITQSETMRKIITLSLSLCICACSMTENGLVLGTPDYEQRDIEVNRLDLAVLVRADALLSSEEHWSKNPSQKCADIPHPGMPGFIDGHDVMASVETIGAYMHRLPALQEVRFTIADNYPGRWKVHRLADFNAHPQTTFSDVKKVLRVTIERVKQKLAQQQADKDK